jgi:excinuclease UvrABC ATPase subunit
MSGRRRHQDRDAFPARCLCDLRSLHGKRYNRETLEVKYKDKSIADVLDMTVEEAAAFFKAVPSIRDKMETLKDVGLAISMSGSRRRPYPAVKRSA